MQIFMLPRFEQEKWDGNDIEEKEDIGIEVNDGVLVELQQFSTWEFVGVEASAERSVRARVVAAWGRRQNVASLVVNCSIDL